MERQGRPIGAPSRTRVSHHAGAERCLRGNEPSQNQDPDRVVRSRIAREHDGAILRAPCGIELLEADVAAVQRMAQERRRQLDQVAAAALNEVRSAMIDVVGELAETRGFNLVLPTSGLLLFAPDIDLTDEVIARLDSKLPNVTVPERAD